MSELLKNGTEEVPITRIEHTKGFTFGFRELWDYHELLYFLVWRDIKVRYKQTVLGASWAILQPFASMVVFSLFFGKLAKMPSDGIPYPLFSYAALVPWTFFTSGVSKGANSLVGGQNILKKVYFPRLAMPIAAVMAGSIDFILAFIVLIFMIFYFGMAPSLNIIWLPFLMLLAVASSLGVSLWLAAMNVKFRDVRFIIPFITQMWLFVTPIVYPSSMIENEILRIVYAINPMVGVVEGFRWALLGTDTAPGPMIIVSVLAAIVILLSGAAYFRSTEKTFADIV